MESNRLVYVVCIAVSVIGVIATALTHSPPARVDSLSPELVGREVVLQGAISSKRVHQGHVFLEVNGFKAVVFESVARRSQTPYFLLLGDEVELKGKVEEYEGEVELVVREVQPC